MTLLEIQDELNVARNFVDCAFLACRGINESDGLAAVLDAASDKIKAIIEALEAIKGEVRA